MSKFTLTRNNEYIPTHVKDVFEIEKEKDGSFFLCIEEPIHGMSDTGMSSSWNITAAEAKQLADFLLSNLEK